MIETLLVANRGEIALRVFRTAVRLGIRPVAIHTDLDADAPHVRAARSWGGDVVQVSSYLDVDEVVAAAVSSGADAVHPGYGFLSERAAFASALETAGVTLVGPAAEVMKQMGRKDHARKIAIAAGVPVIPSVSLVEESTSEETSRNHPGRVGGFEALAGAHASTTEAYPVLVKAAAGGGGKGMRVVRSAGELAEATAAAKREALSAFGDDTMLVEKYVERGRHIEVQVIGDSRGTVLHLFERDCSTQRRHQKVLEEAPAPTLDEATRARVRQASVDLAAHVGYTGAGTVEFLLDADTGEFYFLEMNTRLQVEHPVTEAAVRIQGRALDLVELQLRVAAGEPLGLTQDDVRLEGHAIEARVYAEDSFGGFLPQAGRASVVRWPGLETLAGARSATTDRAETSTTDTTIRVDHALESGQTVSTSYDPMLGKVIAHGPDRESARLALIGALDATGILGLTTNAGFLRALVASDDFRDATIDTAWLDTAELPRPDPTTPRLMAARAWLDEHGERDGPFRSDGFRLGAVAAPTVVLLDEPVTLTGQQVEPPAALRVARHVVEIAHRGQRFVFERPSAARDGAAAPAGGVITAPMPGTVIDVRVAEGDEVAEGAVLGVLEAMKMELSLTAPFAGTVTAVDAVVGEQVPIGAAMFHVEQAEGSA